MNKYLTLFFLLVSSLSSHAIAQASKKEAPGAYVSMIPMSYSTIVDDVPIFSSYTDTAKADNHLVINIPVTVVGHAGNDWFAVKWNERLYYVRPKYIGNPTPLTGPYHNSNSRTIHTGPRGGQYYINSNGNKTYIKH